jgi:hypothetical protein
MNAQAQTELPDRYQWWRAALKAVELGTFDDFVKLAPIVNEQPQAGRYRLRIQEQANRECDLSPGRLLVRRRRQSLLQARRQPRRLCPRLRALVVGRTPPNLERGL